METKHGRSWSLSEEYATLTDPKLTGDVERVEALARELTEVGRMLSQLVERAESLGDGDIAWLEGNVGSYCRLRTESATLLDNVRCYAECMASVDAKNAQARSLEGRVDALSARLHEAAGPFRVLVTLLPEAVFARLLKDADFAQERFAFEHQRRLRDTLLPLAQENLMTGLSVDGFNAWGRLHAQIAGNLTCEVALPEGPSTLGYAKVAGLMHSDDEKIREAAWRGAQAAWTRESDSCATALNAIAGWRLEVNRRRSHTRPVHFLDASLHDNRIDKATLDAMIGAVLEFAEVGRKALRLQARAMGKKALAPWDLSSPRPTLTDEVRRGVPFAEGLELIRNAFALVHPDMAAFVEMMAQRGWIESGTEGARRPGAYCTLFPKSRSPRVYMTYDDSVESVSTLAHELGHAFHSWVMRDLPLVEERYPMTLAETASTFAELIVVDSLQSSDASLQSKFIAGWDDCSRAIGFLLNIPARFGFESEFHERRAQGSLGVGDLKALMKKHLISAYGEELTAVDEMFWASKLHFYITETSFYNYPYTFGYLFSAGIHARQAELGDAFFPSYVALLRDTGRMTAENLASLHLKADIRDGAFWRASLRGIASRVDAFEAALNALGM